MNLLKPRHCKERSPRLCVARMLQQSRFRKHLKTPLPSRGEGWVRGAFSPIDPHPRLLSIQGEGIY